MWLAAVAIVVGLAILVWSADKFIDGATDLAVKFNMPSFLIGVLILGIGTSAPELVVSALSAMAGSPGLALGNAYGSNIINIALVLGATALISPIVIRASVIKQDLMLLIAATAIAAWQLGDGMLTRMEGIILIITLVVVLVLQVVFSLRGRDAEDIPHEHDTVDTTKAWFALVLGLTLLVLSSRAIVWGAVELAEFWGMSELIIGLTIVAVGTSLPELVASIVAARRGEHEMALGNVIGSNLFNTLGVVGLAAIIAPMSNIDPAIFSRDMVMVAMMTGLLLMLCLVALKRKGVLEKAAGTILLTTFVGYTVWLIETAAA